MRSICRGSSHKYKRKLKEMRKGVLRSSRRNQVTKSRNWIFSHFRQQFAFLPHHFLYRRVYLPFATAAFFVLASAPDCCLAIQFRIILMKNNKLISIRFTLTYVNVWWTIVIDAFSAELCTSTSVRQRVQAPLRLIALLSQSVCVGGVVFAQPLIAGNRHIQFELIVDFGKREKNVDVHQTVWHVPFVQSHGTSPNG